MSEATLPIENPEQRSQGESGDAVVNSDLVDSRLRRMLAKSMCRRYQIVDSDGGELPCENHVPCGFVQKCIAMADGVITYTRELNKPKKAV